MGNACGCRGRDSQVNAGSILDRVISQASNEDQCLLYRLANYKKGGELIDAYNHGGQQEVEQVIRGEFSMLMYADGKGQVINRAEYLRWKFRDIEQVILPIEASLSRFDPLAQWSDHEACWQMQYRGSLGETLLHLLIICDTRSHTRIARTLLKCFPRLAIDVVEGEEYLGAGALHLAIAYNNNELVQDLVEAGAIISQRAIGSFFLPRDQQLQRPSRNTDYEGLAYLGEYPLAWAACCANESVYNLLLDSGADPDDQDTFGNMILHMVVVCDKLDMFGYALRHPKFPARNGIANNAGFTPLTLACQLGRAEVFREMLELSAREFWRYSNITCSAYPLNALDTLLPDGRTNWNSALFIILNGTKEEHLDMLDGGIIQRLLEEKWKTFARIDSQLMVWPEELADIGRAIAECITVVGVLSYILVQLGGEVINIGLLSFLKQLSHEPAKFIFLISNILILACIPCRLAENRHAEDAILVVAVPGSWFLMMFFAGYFILYADLSDTTYPNLSKTVFTIFMVLVPILLLNMLIAMMGNTYAHVIEQSEKEFVKQWAKIVVSLERAVSQKDAHNYLQEYSIKLGPGDDPNNPASEQRGVMVIKSKSKTRARQRKGAVANWKRVGKVTINELRKRGMTGEELRCLMWGRASISTPVRTSPHMNEPEISASAGVTGGFGDALTTALDVMAFTHDIDLTQVTDGITTSNAATEAKIQQSNLIHVGTRSEDTITTTHPSVAITTGNAIGNMMISTESNGQKVLESRSIGKNGNSINEANRPDQNPPVVNRDEAKHQLDPLLDLVIASESPESQHDTLLKIAEEARIVSEGKAIAAATSVAALDPQILATLGLGVVPPIENNQETKTKEFFDESSDDICGNNPLGSVARLRRIRSSNIKYFSEKPRSNRPNGIDYSSSSAEENVQSIFHTIDSMNGLSQLNTTIKNPEDAIKYQVKDCQMVNETIEKNSYHQHQQQTQQRVNKNHKRRTKTAKNRIMPKEVNGKVNEQTQMKNNEIISSPPSPTDPLEPWSTRDISDMNTILAWRENGLEDSL
ncbi:hypothetical protein PV326_006175 [Microctonus aethiopoides]|nr:hypothetical protein PV326_006175 [Microctonus aethiopoides]